MGRFPRLPEIYVTDRGWIEDDYRMNRGCPCHAGPTTPPPRSTELGGVDAGQDLLDVERSNQPDDTIVTCSHGTHAILPPTLCENSEVRLVKFPSSSESTKRSVFPESPISEVNAIRIPSCDNTG